MTREFIEKALMDMGAEPTRKGYEYVIEIVQMLDTDEYSNPVWMDIYDYFAKRDFCTSADVQRRIKETLTGIRNKCKNYDIIDHYIGFDTGRNSDSLMRMHKQLSLEEIENKKLLAVQCMSYIDHDLLKEIMKEIMCEMFISNMN